MTETRKIAAILAADVVGFSRMASADEDRTLARLRTLRSELIDPTVASQNGRVFKRIGDGALVEFRSVVEAVRCAIKIQNAMIERNVGNTGRSAYRFPHRHPSRRRRRGERWRSDGRRRQYRGAAGGRRCAGRGLPLRGRLPSGESATRSRGDRPRPDASQEHRRADPRLCIEVGAPLRGKRADARTRPPRAPGQAVDRRAPVPEHERRPGAGIFCRRHGRGHHHRAVAHQMAIRHRPQFELRLQGQGRRHQTGRTRTRRPLCPGRRRAQGRQSPAHHRAS